MKATDLAAWWGAVLATLVLAWDIYKWKHSGAVVNVSVSANMQTFGGIPDELEDKTFVVVEVSNAGDGKTTLTHLVGIHYKSLFQKFRKKRNTAFFVANPAYSEPLPHVLGPGERWVGGIEQNKDLEKMSRDGYLYCGVYHSGGKKPLLQRVIITKDQDT